MIMKAVLLVNLGSPKDLNLRSLGEPKFTRSTAFITIQLYLI